MGKLLFSPSGRIDGRSFYRGAVILLVANVLLWQAWLLGMGAGFVAFLLSLILIYCWGCLFAKRFHDAGKSGWLYLLVFVAFVIVSYLISSVFLAMLSSDIVREVQELKETMDPNNPDVEYLMGVYSRMFKAMVLPFTLGYLITGAAIAFGINAILHSAPGPNQYGSSSENTLD